MEATSDANKELHQDGVGKKDVNGDEVNAVNGDDVKVTNGDDSVIKKEDKQNNISKVAIKRKVEEMDSDEESPFEQKPKTSSTTEMSRHCPYLDTIDRSVLDFDFEKLCSISLSRINVYACLVCGKYFQVSCE